MCGGESTDQRDRIFEFFSPVMQWNAIRLMLVLLFMLVLVSAQTNITADFLHTSMEAGEYI